MVHPSVHPSGHHIFDILLFLSLYGFQSHPEKYLVYKLFIVLLLPNCPRLLPFLGLVAIKASLQIKYSTKLALKIATSVNIHFYLSEIIPMVTTLIFLVTAIS